MMRQEFSAKVKLAAFKRAGGHCEKCTARLFPGKFTYDHIIPDQLGGEPTLENCQVICSACDDKKTYGNDIPNIARAKRRECNYLGIRKPSRFPAARTSRWKKKVDGTVVARDR